MGIVYSDSKNTQAHWSAELMVGNLKDLLNEEGHEIHDIILPANWKAEDSGRGKMSVSGSMIIITGHGENVDVPYEMTAHVRKIRQGWTFGRRSDTKAEARRILATAATAVRDSDAAIERRFAS